MESLSLGILISVSTDVFYEQSRYFKIVFFVCSVFIFALAIVEIARTPIMILMMTLVVILNRHYKKAFRISKVKKTIVLSFIIVVLLSLGYLKVDSLKGRLFIWKNTMVLIFQKPLFGHGSGSFTNTYNKYQVEYFKSGLGSDFEKNVADFVILAYNDFLEIGVELGLLGLGLLMMILILFFNQLYVGRLGNDLLLSLIGFLLFMSTWGIIHESIYCNLLFILFAFCRKTVV